MNKVGFVMSCCLALVGVIAGIATIITNNVLFIMYKSAILMSHATMGFGPEDTNLPVSVTIASFFCIIAGIGLSFYFYKKNRG